MTAGARYALYFAPAPDSRLWDFGSSVIGFDAETGEDRPQPALATIDRDDFHARTADPRQYGFHATLKPPFHLAEGETIDRLLAAVNDFASTQSAFDLTDLDVTAIGAFLALAPAQPSPALHAFADASVSAFDRFRAPLDPADRQRRLKSPLTERQVSYLDRWGYPYVFEDFKFHMTLTGRLHHDERDAVRRELAELYRPIAAPVTVDAITVFEQATRDRRFNVLARIPFG